MRLLGNTKPAPLGTLFSTVAGLSAALQLTTTPTSSAPNCTTNSFTIPSWFIRDFRIESQEKVSFQVFNRASGSTFELRCESPPDNSNVWSCIGGSDALRSSLEVSLRMRSLSAALEVRQSWSCDDRNPSQPLQFSASGNTTIPLTCYSSSSSSEQSTFCKSANPIDLIRGTLHAPISNLTPSYASGPDGHDNPGCTESSSTSPKWSVNTVIYFNETSQDQSFAIPTQSIQFQLVNYATGYVAGCLNYFSSDRNGSEDAGVVINCGGGGGGADSTRRNRYGISTRAVFYPRTWRLEVDQTWFCDDVDAARPMIFSAHGSTILPLKCTADSPTTTACQTPLSTIPGRLITSQSLPPYSLIDPIPSGSDGCTLSSILSPSFQLSNLEISKNVTPISTEPVTSQPADISFNIKLYDKNNINSFFDYPVYVTTAPGEIVDLMDQEKWYTCAFGTGEVPLAPRSCAFQYRNGDGVLILKIEWVCIDLDGGINPVLFSGTATTSLSDLEIECGVGPTGLSVCGTGEGYTWVSGVDGVSWKTTGAVGY